VFGILEISEIPVIVSPSPAIKTVIFAGQNVDLGLHFHSVGPVSQNKGQQNMVVHKKIKNEKRKMRVPLSLVLPVF